MKKLNSIKKLNFAKETVSKLNNIELNLVKGGLVSDAGKTKGDNCKHRFTSPVICTK